jgi:hypothetical protein
MSATGLVLGIEVRVFRWIGLGIGAGQYRPTLEVHRDRGHAEMVDSREATITLRTITLEVIVTPPKWRSESGRIAFGVLLAHPSVSEVPSELGLSIDAGSPGFGVDVRADWYPSDSRHWGVGGALTFLNLDPQFADLETGDAGSVQTGLVMLRLGVRGRW